MAEDTQQPPVNNIVTVYNGVLVLTHCVVHYHSTDTVDTNGNGGNGGGI